MHGTIVYVPLIDLEPAMGSVEFAFGTHVNHGKVPDNPMVHLAAGNRSV